MTLTAYIHVKVKESRPLKTFFEAWQLCHTVMVMSRIGEISKFNMLDFKHKGYYVAGTFLKFFHVVTIHLDLKKL